MLLRQMASAGGTVMGVDWATPLDWARRELGPDVAVQGNLEPLLLGAPRELLTARVDDVLRRAAGASGHVFNLGHGILPDTSPDVVKFVADLVHERTAR
jgi:uroporphyrinogen decarboxylase